MSRFGIATKAYIFNEDKLLLIFKTEEEAEGTPDPTNRVDQPGGRLEFGEEPYDALRREVKEEVGIEVEIVEPIDVWHYVKDEFQLIGINFLCRYKGGDIILSGEHGEYSWMTLEEILSMGWKYKEQYIKAFEKWCGIREEKG